LTVLDQCQSTVNKTQLLQRNSDQKHCASKLRNPLFAPYQCKTFLLCEPLFADAIPWFFSFSRCTLVHPMLGKIRLSMGVHVSFQKRKYPYKDHINLLSYRISYSLLQIVKTATSLNDTSRKFTCKLLSL
jgi:hypothetical protein